MRKEDTEIKNAKKAIDVLKQYDSAKTKAEKDILLGKLDDFFATLIQSGYYTPAELVRRITKAIKLDKYMPKNMSFAQLVTSDDLDYISGDFDTFNSKLHKEFKSGKNPEKMRMLFKCGITNVHLLSELFPAKWMGWLNKHKKLTNAARNANEKEAVDAYNKLFDALTNDFCREYKCKIDAKVVTKWDKLDAQSENEKEFTNGYMESHLIITYVKNMPEAEKQKRRETILKNPENYTEPDVKRKSVVRVNITNIREQHPKPNDFFYNMIGTFAHEMHHALDFQHPRQGALGPQVEAIDKKIYVQPSEDMDKYLSSATEISSRIIKSKLIDRLKSMRF